MSLYLGESNVQRLGKEQVKKRPLSKGAWRGRKGRVPVGVWDDRRHSQGPASGASARTFGEQSAPGRLTQRGVSSLHPALPRPRQPTNNPFIHSPSHPPTHLPTHLLTHHPCNRLPFLEPSCPSSTHSFTISSRTSSSTHSTNYPFARRPSSFDSADKQNPPGQDLGHTVG